MSRWFLILACVVGSAHAADSGVSKNPAASKAGADSATQHSFEDVLVQGKYHFSDEAVTTVEDDKVLDALIGARTDFKDRLQESAEQY